MRAAVSLARSYVTWPAQLVILTCAVVFGPCSAAGRPTTSIADRPAQILLSDGLKALGEYGIDKGEINRRGREIISDGFQMFKEGRYGKHFPKGFDLDLSRTDIRRVATNYLLGNSRNRHGYLRELKYLNAIASKDSPFELLKVNDREWIKSGKLVEFDAVLKDKRSGLRISAEFKDKNITTRAQLNEAKEQIDKISKRAREQHLSHTIWVNKQRLDDNLRKELQSYAANRKVTIYTGVSTSARNLKGRVRFDDVLELESRGVGRYVRWTGRLVGGGATLYGAVKGGYAAYAWQRGGMTTRTATITASEGVGAAAGGAAGVAAGSQIGLLAGSAFPPAAVVTVPAGIFLGGLAGAIAGSWGGKAAGETLVDEVIFKDLEHNETTAVIAYLQQQY